MRDHLYFRYPDPRDPYTGGLSPLRACYEQVALTSEYAAFKQAKFENHAIPDAIVSPDEVIGEEERDRLETQWNSAFARAARARWSWPRAPCGCRCWLTRWATSPPWPT